MAEIPDGIIYAQVEQGNTTQDYAPNRRCVRLVGVDESSFRAAAFNLEAGCGTFFVDIAWDYLLAILLPASAAGTFHPGLWLALVLAPLDDWPDNLWVKIQYTRTKESGAYAYEIFADAVPTYLDLTSVLVVPGPMVAPARTSGHAPTVNSTQTFQLSAFHVGQGMCALLKGQTEGILLDAGAGTPVTRAAYRAGKKSNGATFRNDLKGAVSSLALQVVLSHPDSDHWRVLDWDSGLCALVTAVYLPSSTSALAFKSTHIVSRVHSLGTATTVWNGIGGALLLKAHRSQPRVSDRNGECLVVEVHCNGGIGLFSGDYVYDRMATDGDPAISSLAASTVDAVMVPHHGDTASAAVLISPGSLGATPAFFSAGTHAGYGHPTSASLLAHTSRMFANIDHHTWDDVVEHRLL